MEEALRWRMSFAVFALLSFLMVFLLPSSVAATTAHSPAPAPSNDGVAIDQGVAYLLMLLALVLTYIIH